MDHLAIVLPIIMFAAFYLVIWWPFGIYIGARIGLQVKEDTQIEEDTVTTHSSQMRDSDERREAALRSIIRATPESFRWIRKTRLWLVTFYLIGYHPITSRWCNRLVCRLKAMT